MADAMDVDVDVESPRGIKRKANEIEDERDENQPRRIRALDQDVVNKIAAGEIIVAPVHALKELIENAVDAGSTSLEMLVKEGGLKLLQISDNGCGIEKDDLAILCERFTTSKLQKFEDLQSIATYGFRGEALASISHIAHLSVTTKTRSSDCAWRAVYGSGRLVPAKPGQPADPKPVAGRQGTQITVEDLFYNVPTRRRAFRSASDEYNKIIDMVGRYAIHCAPAVAFSCKKHGESSTSIAVAAGSSSSDRVRQIYGGAVANELIGLDTQDDRWGFRAKGLATNANYSLGKRTTLLLFINHRSVENSNVRKTLEQTYAAFLPKGAHPFVYLSLEVDPARVDVNVHPTKREVNFLNEDEIVQAVCAHLRSKLAAVDTSRTFLTQTLLPGGAWSAGTGAAAAAQRRLDGTSTPAKGKGKAGAAGLGSRKTPARNDGNLVRTDANLRKITSMFTPAAGPGTPGSGGARGSGGAMTPGGGGGGVPGAAPATLLEEMEYETVDREAAPCRLISVRELRAAVRDDMHSGLTEMLANHTFVGVVDERRRLAAVQGGVRLFLVDYGRVCFEYLYQVGLTDFGNFGSIRLSPPLDLRELLTLAAEHELGAGRRAHVGDGKGKEAKGRAGGKATSTASTHGHVRDQDQDVMDQDQPDEDGESEDAEQEGLLLSNGGGLDPDVSELVELAAAQLTERREMLLEYFSLEISPAGELRGLPLLVRGYTPPLVKLPRFLLRLGPHVDWAEEKPCFDSFLRELAAFYVPEQLPPPPAGGESSASATPGGGGEPKAAVGAAAAAAAAATVGNDDDGDSNNHGGDDDDDDDDDDDGGGGGGKPRDDGRHQRLDAETEARRQHVRWAVEHVFFPAFKARLVATKSLMKDGVLEVANLRGLYRVFERC